MSSRPYQGIILAAGAGSRMGSLGAELPKALLPVCNKPIIAYHLDAMHAAGLREVLVLVDERGDVLSQAIGDGSDFGLEIEYVRQPERLGLARAVGLFEGRVESPFLLTLGDIFFDTPTLTDLWAGDDAAAAVLAVREEPDAEALQRNFSVELDADGAVSRLVEKPKTADITLKGCGLYLFEDTIFEAIRATPRSALRNEYELTDAIQILVDSGKRVVPAPVIEWDINLTFIEDLLTCNLHELEKRGLDSLVGQDSRIGDEVELLQTVVGERVTLDGPIRLERCVVQSGVTLKASGEPLRYSDAVIGTSGVID